MTDVAVRFTLALENGEMSGEMGAAQKVRLLFKFKHSKTGAVKIQKVEN